MLAKNFSLLMLAAVLAPSARAELQAPDAFQATLLQQTVLVLSVDKAVVQEWIGPEQKLLDQTLIPDATKNPVMIVHASYKGMAAIPPQGAPFPYDELVVYVPNVQLKDGYVCGYDPAHAEAPGPAAAMPVLYLNQKTPVDIGRAYYGFNKILAQVNVPSRLDSFAVNLTDGTPLYSASFKNETLINPQQDPASFQKFLAIASVMPAAMMGRLANADGTQTMTWSSLKLDFSKAQLNSLDAHAEFKGLLLKGLEGLKGQSLDRKGIKDAEVLGAYRFRNLPVVGSAPMPCRLAPPPAVH